ncbi:MAG: hypothetical protein LBF97_01880 [Elusimicrobiota bacterium]|nr:hypothetical protein [Elusimicrobiota bacterium]
MEVDENNFLFPMRVSPILINNNSSVFYFYDFEIDRVNFNDLKQLLTFSSTQLT